MTEKDYEFRLTKQSFYSSELFEMPIGVVHASTDDEAKALVKDIAARTEIRLSASLIVKVEIKIDDKWVEINE